MKSKIQTAYPQSVFQRTSAETIYVADFTERTNSARKVEIHVALPCVPDSSEAMDCLKLNNRDKVELEFCLFDDHQFKDERGKDISHCECCFFPTQNASGLGFIEIKDCKAKNVAAYKDKVKDKFYRQCNCSALRVSSTSRKCTALSLSQEKRRCYLMIFPIEIFMK